MHGKGLAERCQWEEQEGSQDQKVDSGFVNVFLRLAPLCSNTMDVLWRINLVHTPLRAGTVESMWNEKSLPTPPITGDRCVLRVVVTNVIFAY